MLIIIDNEEKIRKNTIKRLHKIDNHIYINELKTNFEGVIYSGDFEDINGIPNLEESPSGEYTRTVISDDRIIVYVDPIGFNHLYLYDENNVVILSNSFKDIFDLIKQNNFRFSKNKDITASALLIGAPLVPGTGIKEIQLLNSNEYIDIDINQKTLKRQERNYWNFMLDVYSGKYKYQDLLNLAAKRLKNNAINFININKGKVPIVEVTGGLDSRLVLATLLSEDFKDFKIYTFGSPDSFDQRYSQLVQNLFSLDTISYVNDKSRLQAAIDNWLLTSGAFVPVDISFRSNHKRNNYFAFAGTGGELCRGYYFKNTFRKFIKSLDNIYKYSEQELFKFLILQFANTYLLNEEFINLLSEKAAKYYSNYKLSKELYLLLDYSFFQSRIRWHCGEQMKFRRETYIDTISILNDFIFHSLSFSINGYKRLADTNVLNLLEILYPPLKFFPYQDNNPFENRLKSLTIFNLPEKRTISSKLSIGIGKKTSENEEQNRSFLDMYFHEFINNDYLDYFNKKAINKLLANKEAKNKLLERISPIIFWNHFSK